MSFWKEKNILLTGGNGFLGSHIYRKLVEEKDVSPSHIFIPCSKDSDLRVRSNCEKAVENMDVVVHLAARVGGIGFNQKYPGTLFFDNIMMGVQLMDSSRLEGVGKFVQVGTVCAYPKFTTTPFKEDDLWNGYPEETNAPYGIAKKALLVMAQAYRQQYGMNVIYLLPVNLYGPEDNFNLESSHVIPAFVRKFIDAQKRGEHSVTVWGTGKASREFLFVEDAAEGILSATEKYDKPAPVNLGTGKEITIKGLVELVVKLTGFNGIVIWDKSRPDGQPRRCLDVTRAKKEFDFEAKTDLTSGLKKTIEWYTNNQIK
ncbi:MAG TPA: GDP-fucose synthetase [Cytophagales bacterium]|nr:GDP-fucose synthetase [Cytophagales bacterium]